METKNKLLVSLSQIITMQVNSQLKKSKQHRKRKRKGESGESFSSYVLVDLPLPMWFHVDYPYTYWLYSIHMKNYSVVPDHHVNFNFNNRDFATHDKVEPNDEFRNISI